MAGLGDFIRFRVISIPGGMGRGVIFCPGRRSGAQGARGRRTREEQEQCERSSVVRHEKTAPVMFGQFAQTRDFGRSPLGFQVPVRNSASELP